MIYYVTIKSHCEAPDYEDECVAETKEEAISIFLKRLHSWDEGMLRPYVASEKEMEGEKK